MAASGRRHTGSGLEQRLLHAIGTSFPVAAPLRLVVGFSGGPDSLALATALSRVAPVRDLDLLLLHVDHALRLESAVEAAAALELGRQLGLPTRVVRLAASPLDVHQGVGAEEAARRERYRALAEAAGEIEARAVVLAHHRDDRAETVLLHLLRGAGLGGAAGMSALSHLRVPWWVAPPSGPETRLTLFRPFLNEPHTELTAYLTARGLTPVLDASNLSTDHRRNEIRHEALPVLERISPGATAALARFAIIAAEEDAALDAWASAVLTTNRRANGALALAALDGVPVALGRRIVRLWLSRTRAALDLSYERTTALVALAHGGREGSVIELGGGLSATLFDDELHAGAPCELLDAAWKRFPGPRVDWTTGEETPLALGSPARIGSVTFILQERIGEHGGDAIAQSAARPPLVVRRLRRGDRFAGGRLPVRAWLRRAGVPVLLRERLACVANREGVICVPGLQPPGALAAPAGEPGYSVRWVQVEGAGE